MSDAPRDLLFSDDEMIPWREHWRNMPEFDVRDLAPKFQVIVNFSCAGDVEDFARTVGQKITPNNGRQLQSLWYPEQEIGRMVNKRYKAK